MPHEPRDAAAPPLRRSRILAIATWLPRYRPTWLVSDVIAGTTLTAFVVPESLAYAALAGLPAASGLYCYLLGGLVYAIFGSSRKLAVGPTSALSLAIAATLGALPPADAASHASLAATTALLVGCIAIGAWALRLGSMVYFISDTILTGFKIGAGAVIAATQIPKLVGISSVAHGLLPAITDLVRRVGDVRAPSAAIGIGALVLLVAADTILPHRPVSLLVVAAAIALGSVYDLRALGVQLVGEIPAGLPHLGLPSLAPEDITALLPLAFACFLLAYVEGTSVARALADRDGDRIDTNQELLALGAVNLSISFGRGYPASGGTSQSAVNDTAGAETPVSLVVTSTLVAVILLFATGLFRNLPQPVLAALVIAAVTRLVGMAQLRALWMMSGSAFAVAVLTVLGVMILGILEGILIAAIFSLALTVRAIASPRVSVLGRLPGTNVFRELARHPDSERIPGVLIVRPEAELVYFNVPSLADQVLDLTTAAPEPVRLVVLDLSLTPALDVSTAHALGALYDRLAVRGARLRLADLYPAAREVLRAMGMEDRFGPLDTRTTLADAVASAANMHVT